MSNFTFTLSEVATLLGITPKTILYYHQIGLLPSPARATNQYRLYTLAQLTQLQQILRLKQFGLSLQQIEIIIQSDNPDELLPVVLRQHADHLRAEMLQLQNQLTLTQDFLNQGQNKPSALPVEPPLATSLTILTETIKRRSHSIADILVAIERQALYLLDQYAWDVNYPMFWQQTAQQFLELTDEGQFIFWMERYLALETMAIDDLQGNAWLQELRYSTARRMLQQALMPPTTAIIPPKEQQQILKLLPLLLHQTGTPLQQQFLQLLVER
jgi:DNA-binding transcriptional MerR regulator